MLLYFIIVIYKMEMCHFISPSRITRFLCLKLIVEYFHDNETSGKKQERVIAISWTTFWPFFFQIHEGFDFSHDYWSHLHSQTN